MIKELTNVMLEQHEWKKIWDEGATVTNTAEGIQQSGISKWKDRSGKCWYTIGDEMDNLFGNLEFAVTVFLLLQHLDRKLEQYKKMVEVY